MTNVYYTARRGRRNRDGHVTTRGKVYKVMCGNDTTPHGVDALESIGEYSHMSGGPGVEMAILTTCARAGIFTGGGYFGNWREFVNLIEI